jgi:hypothetical protein
VLWSCDLSRVRAGNSRNTLVAGLDGAGMQGVRSCYSAQAGGMCTVR